MGASGLGALLLALGHVVVSSAQILDLVEYATGEIWSSILGDYIAPGPFLLAETTFRPLDFKFLDDIEDPSPLRKTWEFTGTMKGVLARLFETDTSFSGHLSVVQDLSLSESQMDALGIPREAKQFAFSYPVSELEGALDDAMTIDPDVAFFGAGGYMYFDAQKTLLAAMSLRKDVKRGLLKFEPKQKWLPRWSKHIPGNLFHHTTFPVLTKAGISYFMWIPPREMFGNKEEKDRHQKGGVWYGLMTFLGRTAGAHQPNCPHGCFAYLSHHPKMKVADAQRRKDVYYSLKFDTAKLDL